MGCATQTVVCFHCEGAQESSQPEDAEAPAATIEDSIKALVMNSGKMALPDKLLARLRADEHRVLIDHLQSDGAHARQLTNYMNLRGYPHQHLDSACHSP